MKLLLLGLPGAGKGSVGTRLAAHLSIPHLSVGDRVRELSREESSIGARLRAAFTAATRWQPLSDELAVQVAEMLTGDHSQWILDGFPRNVSQAEQAKWLSNVTATVFLKVSPEIARTRVIGRCREGDTVEKFELRLAAEAARLPQLVEWIRTRIPLVEVDAERSVEVVSMSVVEGLKKES